MTKIILAALHLIALGLGLGAVVNRGTALRDVPDAASLKRIFHADTLWGIAAALWLVTGLWRFLGGVEKGAAYYQVNSLFHTKMALFIAILALEIWPMVMLIRWRIAARKGETPTAIVNPHAARRMAMISHIEALLVVLMVFAAVAMARGYGAGMV